MFPQKKTEHPKFGKVQKKNKNKLDFKKEEKNDRIPETKTPGHLSSLEGKVQVNVRCGGDLTMIKAQLTSQN